MRAIQLQLAREEYQLLTEELEAISPQEWAGTGLDRHTVWIGGGMYEQL